MRTRLVQATYQVAILRDFLVTVCKLMEILSS